MCKVGKIILKVFAILAAIAGVVAAVYYWNLDQKLLDWFYKKTEGPVKIYAQNYLQAPAE